MRKFYFEKLLEPTEVEYKNIIKIFLIALTMSVLILAPFVIIDRGMFCLCCDYNWQVIPFYKSMHNSIQNLNFGWDWKTDLGTNFIASFNFYGLCSPFFWLTIPFKNNMIPYLMAPILALKIAFAAPTSYVFIRRFTKTSHAAFIGALLYAFSGYTINFMTSPVNGYTDAVVMFPLILFGIEKLFNDNEKGFLAIAIFLNALVDVQFFIISMVGVTYFLLFRILYKSYHINMKRIISAIFEFIVGLMISTPLLLPSTLMTAQNPRFSRLLPLKDWILFKSFNRYLRTIIGSVMYPSTLDTGKFPDFDNIHFITRHFTQIYLPIVGILGILTIIVYTKRNWIKSFIIFLSMCMLIPVLNQSFMLFNKQIYLRWSYIFILFAALSTAIALENFSSKLFFGIKIHILLLIFSIIIGIFPIIGEKTQPPAYFISCIISLIGILIFTYIIRRSNNNFRLIYKYLITFLAIFTTIYCQFYIFNYPFVYFHSNNSSQKIDIKDYFIQHKALKCENFNLNFNIENRKYQRVYFLNPYCTLKNCPSISHTMSAASFTTTVVPSIIQFHDNLFFKRIGFDLIYPENKKVGPIGRKEFLNLCNFLSVKYLFLERSDNIHHDQIQIPLGYKYYDYQNGFDIYENEHCIPIGFAIDRYIEPSDIDNISKENKNRLLYKGLFLNDEQIEKYKDILKPVPKEEILENKLTNEQLIKDSDHLRKNCCENFSYNSYGFKADISLNKDSLILFTVPFETGCFDSGWTATVNGIKTTIEKVDYGMMAVKCRQGENRIEFKYRTPGLLEGAVLSTSGLILYIIYIVIVRKKEKQKKS